MTRLLAARAGGLLAAFGEAGVLAPGRRARRAAARRAHRRDRRAGAARRRAHRARHPARLGRARPRRPPPTRSRRTSTRTIADAGRSSCPGPSRTAGSPRARRARSSPAPPAARRCRWSAPRCGSTGTGGRRCRSPTTCCGAAPTGRPTSTRPRCRPTSTSCSPTPPHDQRQAVALAALSRVGVIAGGPGTGKTTTVAQLIAVLRRRLGPELRIALAAPTGKAAARLEEAVHAAPGRLSDGRPRRARRAVRLDAAPAARLAARRVEPVPARPRQPPALRRGDRRRELDGVADADGPAARGARARRPGWCWSATRTSSRRSRPAPCSATCVDERDAAARLGRRRLRTVHRFDAGGPIAELAELVRAGRGDDALALLRSGPAELRLPRGRRRAAGPGRRRWPMIERDVVAHEGALIAAAREPATSRRALDALDRHRLLCAHRAGPRGVRHWTALAERWLPPSPVDATAAGRPLRRAAAARDRQRLRDRRSTTATPASSWPQGDELAAAFRRGGAPTVLPLVRLGDVRPLHAMTVHRAQGSQFDAVTVLLPLADVAARHPADVLHRDHPRGVAGAARRLGRGGAGLRRPPDRPRDRACAPAWSPRSSRSRRSDEPGRGAGADSGPAPDADRRRPPSAHRPAARQCVVRAARDRG